MQVIDQCSVVGAVTNMLLVNESNLHYLLLTLKQSI